MFVWCNLAAARASRSKRFVACPLIPSAGGTFAIQGDYLFRDHMGLGSTAGLWGIVRVGEPAEQVPQDPPPEPEEPPPEEDPPEDPEEEPEEPKEPNPNKGKGKNKSP